VVCRDFEPEGSVFDGSIASVVPLFHPVREPQTYCVGIKSKAGLSSDPNFVTSAPETKVQLAPIVPSFQKCLSSIKDRFNNIVGFALSVA